MQNKTFLITASIAVIVLVVGVISLAINNNDSNDSQKEETVSQSSSISTQTANTSLESSSDNTSSRQSEDRLVNTDLNNSGEDSVTAEDLEIEEQLDSLSEFLEAGVTEDVTEFDFNNYTETEFQAFKSSVEEYSASVASQEGKVVKLTVSYTSVGDEPFEKGTLFVQFGNGVSLIEDSIEDNFKDSGFQKVDASVYNKETKTIEYGPGSYSSKTSRVGVTDAGELKFSIQIDNGVTGSIPIASYLQDEDGKMGQPGIIFVEIE